MKKRLLIICLVVIGLSLLVSSVSALDIGFGKVESAATQAGYSGATSETTFAAKLGVGVKAALSFLGVAFLGLMVYAGYLWMTARGEEEMITKAQKIVITAVVGLVIVVGTYGVTNMVVPLILSRTTGSGGEKDIGEIEVHCCNLEFYSAKPPSEHNKVVMMEEECEENNGKFLGMMMVEECLK